jgi:hypothetical protein
MSVKSENHAVRLMKIQPEERLATISELNLASRLVTGCGEAWGKGAAATQVKGWSNELFIVPEVDVVHVTEGSTLIADRPTWTWQGDESPVGSKTVARYQMDCMRTRKGQRALSCGVCATEPMNGKMVQTTLRELRRVLINLFKRLTDQFMVPVKQGNARGGKGLAGVRWTNGNTPSIPREGLAKHFGRTFLTSKKLRRKMKDMNQWLKSIQNRVALNVWWQVLTQKLIGHYPYYGIRVNRRSQKRSYNWEQFNRFLSFNPLPTPTIYHFYTLSKRRGCTPEEPDEGKPQVRFCEGAHSSLGAITPLGGVL